MNNNIELSREYELVTHQKGKAYPIEVTDWEYIKKEIKGLPHCESIYLSFSLFLFGISVTSLFSLLSSNFELTWYLITTWILLIASFIIGILCLLLNDKSKKMELTKSKAIVSFFEQLESRFNC